MWWSRCRPLAYRLVAARMSGAAGGDKRKGLEEEPGVGQPPTKKQRSKKGKRGRPGERYVPPPSKKNLGISFSHQHFSGECGRAPLEHHQSSPRFTVTSGVDNDFMRNTVHRHEPPVTAQPIVILSQNDDLVVVDKPASIPVHPCGRFRHNTVIFILGKEYNLTELHTIHRLDRLTSGVLMFARKLEVSKKMDQQVRERQVQKEYVCRVEGEFPNGDVICEEPILVVSYKVGVCRVHPAGKPCRTAFQRLSYNGRSSVVCCRPYTGRTHQIRVHLQYLGHPIVNDPVYNTEAWGSHRARGGRLDKTDEELLRDLVELHRLRESLDLLDLPDEPQPGASGQTESQAEEIPGGGGGTAQLPGSVKDKLCGECRLVRKDPLPEDLVMYLHALKYTGPDWEYSSPLPAWAAADWDQN
ncbi:pseudouridylate synthase RPUSD2 isoform X2 [Mobula birostris]|uniref:pseudouridylate synthase RPUSD2 isoform X2 n=1 Tax=Mobula birostris TaxID=1983395 RepID=UPI003B28D0D9